MPTYAADLASVRAAARRIAPHAHRTPVLTSRSLDDLAGRQLLFKCENLQRTGSFKIRGAMNAVLALPEERARHGVVTHSSGNFAQALALAARVRGIAAHIVMPRDAPAVKRAAVEAFGGRVALCEPTLAAREARAAEVGRATGAVFVHPYDHPDVIAGQGTCGLELAEQLGSDLDFVVVPVGGGGLVSGIALALHELLPRVRVIAAEPSGADDAWRSVEAGTLLPQTDPRTIADGLRTSLGQLTWPVLRDVVDRVVRVEEEAIRDATVLVMSRLKVVMEPSAAVAAAVALSGALPPGARTAVVLSGGNIDLVAFFSGLAAGRGPGGDAAALG